MKTYEATLTIHEEILPTPITVELTDDTLTMKIGDESIADWARNDMRVSALPDGFHIRAEGEVVILNVEDDAQFAIDLGLRNAHPTLRRKMSALLREQ